MSTARVLKLSLFTDNLPVALGHFADALRGESEPGERYQVEIVVHGPLTIEECVTTLWEKVRVVEQRRQAHLN